MPDIVLATLNARYIHCAFGLRYLHANMGELQSRTALLEFTISQPTLEMLDAILEQQPRLVGLGVYIWNVEETTRLIADLKRVRPDIIVVLGGPEVSYETDDQPIVRLADYVIAGEADLAFAQLCREQLAQDHPVMISGPLAPALRGEGQGEGISSTSASVFANDPTNQDKSLIASESLGFAGSSAAATRGPVAWTGEFRRGETAQNSNAEPREISAAEERKSPHPNPSPRKAGARGEMIAAPLPVLTDLVLPYENYSDEDIAHRVIYVEASRGCPFTCEFCLSALDIPVRQFSLDAFLAALDSLMRRGARQFKFVDRTFNLNLRVGRAILEFFLERYQPGLFLHFEMIPDRLPESLKELIVKFPPGALQFEVGIQTFNEDVCELISRRQENELAEQNLSWLRQSTGVHVHADLIVGLPGETVESFAAGFDRLVRLNPHEIQVGILKRLRGTPIIRHDVEWEMIYSPHPPYEILSNKLLDYSAIQELRRFAKFWDALANSGNFVETLPLFWNDRTESSSVGSGIQITGKSPFHEFRRLANWMFEQERKTHGIPLGRLIELVLRYATEVAKFDAGDVAATLWRDYQRGGRSDKPHCLRPFIETIEDKPRQTSPSDRDLPKRQARHRLKSD